MPYTFRVYDHLADIPKSAWDALVDHDQQANAFSSWTFLEALESSGCASLATGWRPQHLTLWRGADLVAAAPAYARSDSDGDFSRDWGWADAALRAGIRYYPKLIVTVPFTPVTGRRMLVAAGEDRAAAVHALIDGAHALAREQRLSSVQVLFPTPDETIELAAAGLAPRVSVQFHWHNRGHADYAAWLASLDSKRRHQAKREAAAPAEQGITLRTIRGEELAADPTRWGRTAGQLHRSTVDKLMWGRHWLNQAFYDRIFARMPESVEVVVALRAGEVVAGAFNVSSRNRLFGRYWGCLEEHPFLHFNVCLYHSIDDAIRRGIQVFEGGAGGEHKLSRGFEPTQTHSAHSFLDPRLDEPIRAHLIREIAAREQELSSWRERKGKKGLT